MILNLLENEKLLQFPEQIDLAQNIENNSKEIESFLSRNKDSFQQSSLLNVVEMNIK